MRSNVICGLAVLVVTLMLVACGGPPQLSWESLNKYDFNVVEADPGLTIPSRHLYERMYFSRLASAGGPVSDSEIQFFRDSLTVDTLISLSNEAFDLVAHWYQYRDYRDRVNTWLRQEFWQREVSSKVVVDSQEVLTGTVYKYGKVEGAWSRNRGFATLAEDYIKHDIYIMKIIRRFDRTLQERFGNRYKTLRDIFTDEEAK